MSQIIQIICGPTLVREVMEIFRAYEVRGYYRQDDMRAVEMSPAGGPSSSTRMLKLSSLMVILPTSQAQGVLDELRNLRRSMKKAGVFRVITWTAETI